MIETWNTLSFSKNRWGVGGKPSSFIATTKVCNLNSVLPQIKTLCVAICVQYPCLNCEWSWIHASDREACHAGQSDCFRDVGHIIISTSWEGWRGDAVNPFFHAQTLSNGLVDNIFGYWENVCHISTMSLLCHQSELVEVAVEAVIQPCKLKLCNLRKMLIRAWLWLTLLRL